MIPYKITNLIMNPSPNPSAKLLPSPRHKSEHTKNKNHELVISGY